MVAVIHTGRSLRQTLQYNEQKVAQVKALLLEAVHYPKAAPDLSFSQKLRCLEKRAQLNERTQVNCVHISLNFDPSERLSAETLKAVATAYMQGIGFGAQPYLMYQHLDAGHPHLHLVTTNIQSNGKRLALHHLGKNFSEKTRQRIEQTFGLVRAQHKKRRQQPVMPTRIQYGKVNTKQAIERVLDTVLLHYRYTTLDQLNAVLRPYSVLADRGSQQSQLYQLRGLYYRVLDEKGKKIGSPIKASAFENKPTLKYLEQQFQKNQTLKQGHQQRIQSALNWALLRPQSFSQLVNKLEQEGIHTVLAQNKAGTIEGLTFIDHCTKCVFEAEELGSNYTTRKIKERCSETVAQEQHPKQVFSLKERLLQTLRKEQAPSIQLPDKLSQAIGQTAAQIMAPNKEDSEVPRQSIQQKKKRKRLSHNL
jgi:hypothetical protein